MNFIYTEEFRLHLKSIWNNNDIVKLVINQSGIAILSINHILYQHDILNIIPCKYVGFMCEGEIIKSYSTEDLTADYCYNPKLSLPIYCWFRVLPDFLKIQRKVEELIEGQRLAKFSEYDLRICYVV